MTLMKSSWVSREKNVEDDIIENDNWKKTWQNTRDRIQSVWFDEYNRIESNRNGSFQPLNDFKTVCCEYSDNWIQLDLLASWLGIMIYRRQTKVSSTCSYHFRSFFWLIQSPHPLSLSGLYSSFSRFIYLFALFIYLLLLFC
jgi:hypothetical protein